MTVRKCGWHVLQILPSATRRFCRSQILPLAKNVDKLACHTSPGRNVASPICRFGRFCNLQIPSFVHVILPLLGKLHLPNGVCKLQIHFRLFLFATFYSVNIICIRQFIHDVVTFSFFSPPPLNDFAKIYYIWHCINLCFNYQLYI